MVHIAAKLCLPKAGLIVMGKWFRGVGLLTRWGTGFMKTSPLGESGCINEKEVGRPGGFRLPGLRLLNGIRISSCFSPDITHPPAQEKVLGLGSSWVTCGG